jgi:hypothetical protein
MGHHHAQRRLRDSSDESHGSRHGLREEVQPVLTYVILSPESEDPLGYIRSAGVPTPEEMADHLAVIGGFANRDHFLHVNPGIQLGYAPLQ